VAYEKRFIYNDTGVKTLNPDKPPKAASFSGVTIVQALGIQFVL
jgi:hypothetical protein